jgi:YhcH/YjgK/YiaL family protein
MYKKDTMKEKNSFKSKITKLFGILILFTAGSMVFQPCNAQVNIEPDNWFNSREWANGLKLDAHKSTDIKEFYSQYAKNKAYWDKAFAYLRDTDLENVASGKYNLDGDNVYVSVTEGPTKTFENTKWEAHRKYIDIQYVVRGKEQMGVAPLSKAVNIEPYNSDKDIGFYQVPEDDCKYYVAEPGTFLIFFPQDAHRPSIKTEGTDADKKIVIKIKVG